LPWDLSDSGPPYICGLSYDQSAQLRILRDELIVFVGPKGVRGRKLDTSYLHMIRRLSLGDRLDDVCHDRVRETREQIRAVQRTLQRWRKRVDKYDQAIENYFRRQSLRSLLRVLSRKSSRKRIDPIVYGLLTYIAFLLDSPSSGSNATRSEANERISADNELGSARNNKIVC
jgi:hypothetical protein